MASVDQASKQTIRPTWMRTSRFLALTIALGSMTVAGPHRAPCAPNFIVIVADDLGFGDLGSYGNTEIRTPALDRLAAEGVRLKEFYTPAPTCSPARAALLTGRHPLRTGVTRVFVPKEVQGLPAEEITLAEHLKDLGYATACIGKWHLGGRKQHRPPSHGFDEFFGVLYSNNMVWLQRFNWPRIELFDGNRSIESPADTSFLTRRYTHRAIEFIHRKRDAPFFLYVAYTMPHIPLAASPEFTGRSRYGPYGDVVEELDASIGHLMAELQRAGLAGDTYVFFTSDNGPWLGDESTRGGATGGLRGFKGTTWEGGLRIPLIAWGPGRLPSASCGGISPCSICFRPSAGWLRGPPRTGSTTARTSCPVARQSCHHRAICSSATARRLTLCGQDIGNCIYGNASSAPKVAPASHVTSTLRGCTAWIRIRGKRRMSQDRISRSSLA